MQVVLVCNRFDGYSKNHLYSAYELANHVIEFCWTYQQSVVALFRMSRSEVMFIKIQGTEFYVSTESKKCASLF